MADLLKQITDLNNKIEKLMQKKTKVEAQKELLENKLREEIESYESKYDVKLNGGTFAETKKNIVKESKKVSEEVEKAYFLSKKVVSAVEDGDIATAYSLLGIEIKEEVDEEDSPTEDLEEVQEEVKESEEFSVEMEDDATLDLQVEDDEDDIEASVSYNFSGVDLSVEDDTEDLEDSDDFYSDMGGDDDDEFGFGAILEEGRYE